ncbi:8645108f-4bc1-4022-b3b4-2d7d93505d7c [Sclerotinia trifoliorum]|uniref:8645108f-4bc1-4022-b3b4-2d7d93505d7c n=1 Tax=Sclerotinia trifoliorum TaxID=28548 RepID=A0A8H2ZMN0_9HELO|nr:8645108f-4bc1-4022-b3b4-2d7d93505d7c [Sclerotinia trifoliorum]
MQESKMCNTYTIILNCTHKQTYTHRCSLYLGNPRQKCVKASPTIAHYLADCRKCRGQDKDNFVVVWVEKKIDGSAVDEEEGNRNYMLGIGGFDIVANGDKRGREKGVRVYQDGMEEARREKNGVRNVSSNVSATDMARFDAELEDDMYSQATESAKDISPDTPRTKSLPLKVKSKKPSVFGSLRKMIVRPKSEQDTTATGGFRGSKKSEGSEEHNSMSGSSDERRIDDATGYEYLTPKEFLDLHFQGVVAGTGSSQATVSNATSAPIDIPQRSRPKASQGWTAQRHAAEYMTEIGGSPFTDKSAIMDSFTDGSKIPDFKNSYQGMTSERRSNDTNSNKPGRISQDTQFSQSDEERADIISYAKDGETINITPQNIDSVLAVWKGSLGTSSSSSHIRIPSRPHALDHPIHSHRIDALPVPFRSQGLNVADHSTSLPIHRGVEGIVARAQWAQGNVSEKVFSVPSAALQHAIDFVEPRDYRDMPKRNNTTKEPTRGFAIPKRSHTGAIPHPRHPLANEITRRNTVTKNCQAQKKNEVASPDIPEPVQETMAGTRYSSLPSSPSISPSVRIKDNEQDRQSPRLWNRKGIPTSKPESHSNLSLQDRAGPANDRSSIVTTFSQFIPSRNGELDGEIDTDISSAKISAKLPRRRMGTPNTQNRMRDDAIPIPEVPVIPESYVKHTTILPKISRDATGRFSVENIEGEKSGGAVSSLNRRVSEGASEEVNIEESEDIYANHTIGTWDAVLRNGMGDVSPVSSVEDMNRDVSPSGFLSR